MSDEKCNCFDEVIKRWPEPFHKPIQFNMKDGQMSVADWFVKVYSLNPSGTIKKGTLQNLMINFCPICGCQLTEEPK